MLANAHQVIQSFPERLNSGNGPFETEDVLVKWEVAAKEAGSPLITDTSVPKGSRSDGDRL